MADTIPAKWRFGAKREARKRKHPALPSGRPIRFRAFQQLIWVGMSILLGAGFIAGLYWLFFEQRYHFLGLNISLKNWWDGEGPWASRGGMGFIKSPHWDAYRHSIRDLGEPALWIMIGATVLGKIKVLDRSGQIRKPRLVPKWGLLFGPLALLCLLIAGAVAISYETTVGALSHGSDPLSYKEIVLGAALGRLLHYLWMPFGNTIRWTTISRSVIKGRTPLWVTLPLMPPTWREAWSVMDAADTNPTLPKEDRTGWKRFVPPMKVVVPVGLFLFVVIAVIGDLAKYAVAHGVAIPGMTT